jgi:hypothetical protein
MALTDTILKGDHPRIISAKFGWDWLSSFRGEDFFFNFIWSRVVNEHSTFLSISRCLREQVKLLQRRK